MTRLIPKKEAAARRGVHPNHLMTLVAEGKFPAPIKGDGQAARVYFVESEVEDEIVALAAARNIEPMEV